MGNNFGAHHTEIWLGSCVSAEQSHFNRVGGRKHSIAVENGGARCIADDRWEAAVEESAPAINPIALNLHKGKKKPASYTINATVDLEVDSIDSSDRLV